MLGKNPNVDPSYVISFTNEQNVDLLKTLISQRLEANKSTLEQSLSPIQAHTIIQKKVSTRKSAELSEAAIQRMFSVKKEPPNHAAIRMQKRQFVNAINFLIAKCFWLVIVLCVIDIMN